MLLNCHGKKKKKMRENEVEEKMVAWIQMKFGKVQNNRETELN